METSQTIYLFVVLIQLFFCLRYAIKASFGNAPEYRFYKLLIVLLVPVAGYFMVMKEPVEVS